MGGLPLQLYILAFSFMNDVNKLMSTVTFYFLFLNDGEVL